jgi:hypothetical protein
VSGASPSLGSSFRPQAQALETVRTTPASAAAGHTP